MSAPVAEQPRSARSGNDLGGRLTDVLLWLGLIGLATATALRWLDVAQTPVVAVQAARPLVGLASCVLLVVVMVTRRWRTTAVGAALVVVHAVVWLPSMLPDTAVPGSDDLVVMVSNVQFGGADARTLADAVEAQQVDVLVLLEVTAAGAQRLDAAGLPTALPERVGRTREDPGGTMVLSRLPLTEVPGGAVATFDQPVVQVETGAGPVVVHTTHPLPPTQPRRWHDELEGLDGWVRAQPSTADGGLPLVVAGDLNATEDHPVFRALTSGADGLTDAHGADGAGWVRTWPVGRPLPPVVHLDHVLVRDLGVLDTGVITVPGTDHRAVWARLALP